MSASILISQHWLIASIGILTSVWGYTQLLKERERSASLTGEVKSFFTGVDEIKITVNGERFRLAKPTGKVLVIRGIKKPSGECFSLVIKKEDARARAVIVLSAYFK